MNETDRLTGNIMLECSIRCSSCRKEDILHNADIYDAGDYFINEGWRATKENVYCPECGKKKLKSRKNQNYEKF